MPLCQGVPKETGYFDTQKINYNTKFDNFLI